jgi:hypothetical protein
MLIDYSERAYELLYRPLSESQKSELFEVFLRIGEALSMLYAAYRRHLGLLRYYLLLEVQALLVPDQARRLLRLNSNPLVSGLAQVYGLIGTGNVQSLVHTLLIPPRYWSDVRAFDRT